MPGSQLQVAVLLPKQSLDVSLPLVPGGPVLKMQPVSMLQVAMKNNIDVFYFSAVIPMNVLFTLDGKMGVCVCVCVCVGGWVYALLGIIVLSM